MVSVDVYNMKKEKVRTLEIPEGLINYTVNKSLLHEIVLYQLAKRRAGTASTKNVAKVSGSNRKPWKQKGTGRARAGSNKSPLWVGGGITFGPQPRDYSYSINKKKKQKALKSAIKAKIDDGCFIVLNSINIESGKTKDARHFLETYEATRKVLFIYDNIDDKTERSFRNLDYVKLLSINGLNVYDIINAKTIILDEHTFNNVLQRCSDVK
jgi:large subunit ribosomal protein L4